MFYCFFIVYIDSIKQGGWGFNNTVIARIWNKTPKHADYATEMMAPVCDLGGINILIFNVILNKLTWHYAQLRINGMWKIKIQNSRIFCNKCA